MLKKIKRKVIAITLIVIMAIGVIGVYGKIISNTGEDPLIFTDLDVNPNVGYTVGLMYYDIWRYNNGTWTGDGKPGERHTASYDYRFRFDSNKKVKSAKVYVFKEHDSKHMNIWDATRNMDYVDDVKPAVGESVSVRKFTPSGIGTNELTINVSADVTLNAPKPVELTKEWQGQNVIGLRYYIPIVIEVEFEPTEGTLFVKHFTTKGQPLSTYNYDKKIEPNKDYTISKTDIPKMTYKGFKYKEGTPPSSGQAMKEGENVSFKYDGKNKEIYIFFYYEGEAPPQPPTGGGDSSGEDLDPSVSAVIRADNRGSEKFEVLDGIPTTEDLYVQVDAKEFLYKYSFSNITGTKDYNITVSKTYNLTWKEDHGHYETCHHDDKDGNCTSDCHEDWVSNWVTFNDTETVSNTYTVSREFAYWIISELQIYGIDKSIVNNYALPNGETITLYPSGYSKLNVSVNADSSESAHIREPQFNGSITMPSESIDGGTSKPSVPSEDWTSIAEEAVKEIEVRNDRLEINGSIIMEDSWQEKQTSSPNSFPTPNMIDENVLYKNALTIEAEKRNKDSAPSTGEIHYSLIASVGGGSQFLTYPIEGINPVTVHTPVVCFPSVHDDKDFNQKVKPDMSRVSVILDRPNSISIPTVGQHLSILGYGYQDYAKYTRKKQVKFPFDIYKGTDRATGTYIKADTWIDVPLEYDNMNFYTPIWVDEGNYDVEFRAIAINAPYDTSYEHNANLDLRNYVAYEKIPVQVIGRLYDFKITDIEDYPTWQDVFRVGTDTLKHTGNYYWIGTKDQNGKTKGNSSEFTVPIINGSHPSKDNIGVLPTGYKFKFELVTIGNLFNPYDCINITPTFYYVDKNGQNRQQVDLYYSENIEGKDKNFVKVGSTTDKNNPKYMRLGNADRNVPESEIKATAYVLGIAEETLKNNKTKIGYFSQVVLPSAARMFIGDTYMTPSGVDPVKVKKSQQHWYGEYYLPNKVYAVPKDYDVFEYAKKHGLNGKESFWLKNGYIMVNFKIDTVKDQQFSSPDLSYYDVPLGNMWNIEGAIKTKVDDNNVSFTFNRGDMILYDLDKKASDDYKSGGTH